MKDILGVNFNTRVTYTHPGNVTHLTFLWIKMHNPKSLKIPAWKFRSKRNPGNKIS